MRGAARYIIQGALSVLSLGLCILVVVLWVRSFWVADSYRPVDGGDLIAYQSYRGRLHYVHVRDERLRISDQKYPPTGWSSAPIQQALLWQEWNGPSHDSYTFLGFGYTNSLNNFTISAFPYWAFALLLVVLPIQAAPGFVRWMRKVPIHCHKCGKRVRGLATKCPRCGHTIVETVPPPPPIKEAPPLPRPSKKVRAVVVKSATPDRTHSRPTGGSDRSVL